MTTLEALLALQELFSDPARHTRLYLARDIDGHACAVNSLDATCWCFLGGVEKVTGEEVTTPEAGSPADELFGLLNSAAFACHSAGLIYTNDHLGLNAVRQVITHAIASERAANAN